ALQILLWRYTGQGDFLLATPIAGRSWPEIEGLIGFFLNTLLVRADLVGSRSCSESLALVAEMTRSVYTHQEVPFERLVGALQPERDLSRMPLFQVMLTLQNAPLPSLRAPGVAFRPYPLEVGTVQVDLALTFEEAAHGITGTVSYARDLFDI